MIGIDVRIPARSQLKEYLFSGATKKISTEVLRKPPKLKIEGRKELPVNTHVVMR